uniref:uncharacterized protein LOC105353294 n=1 Tax=Fragaria vesca subsp. vesca TaxID=101020 RepID=UPI0005C8990B|nr:PREDICTED: uncharacterized protein LOC105353294 [Fragaria vesca subsp. vesca]
MTSTSNTPREFSFAANELSQVASGLSLRDGVRERLLKVERRTLPSFIARGNIRPTPHGYYWPTILKDYIAFAKGCQDCQAHGPVQHIPNIPLQPIIKPWPGRGWVIDFVGIIHPHSSEQHKFIIMATDFFTKWVEVEPLMVASANSCIITDRGAAFMADFMVKFHNDYGVKLLHSTPYYTQSNGQAEANNKNFSTHCGLTALQSAVRTPYALMYGHDAVLPLEINIASLRVQEQHQLLGEDYVQAMWQELEDLDEHWVTAYNNLVLEK